MRITLYLDTRYLTIKESNSWHFGENRIGWRYVTSYDCIFRLKSHKTGEVIEKLATFYTQLTVSDCLFIMQIRWGTNQLSTMFRSNVIIIFMFVGFWWLYHQIIVVIFIVIIAKIYLNAITTYLCVSMVLLLVYLEANKCTFTLYFMILLTLWQAWMTL